MDTCLNGILRNPMRDVADAIADNANANNLHADTVRALHVVGNLGDPPDTFPDHVQLEDDPIGVIRDFDIVTTAVPVL